MRFLFRFRMLPLLLGLLLLPLGSAYAATYTVSPGDTLYLIGLRYGAASEELQAANGLQGDLIYPGQQLVVPGKATYTVQPGDSLYFIGLRFGVPYQRIMLANRLTDTVIYPGQVLAVPLFPWEVENGVSRGGTRYTASDLDLLARLITAEADSESYLTKVAVGAVVLNRVKSPLFPNTITGVIYQVDETGSYQFTPALNGWINRPASPDSIRAAKEALAGADPTRGALYFFESWVTNPFLRSRPVSLVLDSFTFTF